MIANFDLVHLAMCESILVGFCFNFALDLVRVAIRLELIKLIRLGFLNLFWTAESFYFILLTFTYL